LIREHNKRIAPQTAQTAVADPKRQSSQGGHCAWADIPKETAYEVIREKILRLNPTAQDKKISKFILG